MRSFSHRVHAAALGALLPALALAVTTPALAQYSGENFHGDFGVNSGTQPPPGFFLSLPYGEWQVNDIRSASGDQYPRSNFKGFDLRVLVPSLVVVTRYKVVGANYGFVMALPFSKVHPERVTDAIGEGSWGLADMYVVPVNLGWHTSRADFVAGYGFYAPTGKYSAGATDNVGLGMWSHELQGGTTVYLDEAKKFTAATTAYFEMHSKKQGEDVRVGNLLTLEGGAAYNVPKIAGSFGIGYYLQNKVSHDTGNDIPTTLLRTLNLSGLNQVFGIGPDLTMGVFQRGTTVGSMNVRYFWDASARTSFKGSTLMVSFTVGQISM